MQMGRILCTLASALFAASFARESTGFVMTHELSMNQSVKSPLVEIYYETRCPYSLQFLNDTLRRAWNDEELRRKIDIKLYPFGNARLVDEEEVSEGYHFWHPDAHYPIVACQHQETECFGNMIQACAIDLSDGPEIFVPFVMCMASYGIDAGVELSSYECGRRVGLDMHAVKQCAESERGSRLIAATGAKSMNPRLNKTYVPFITIDGEPTLNGSLLEPLCGLYSEAQLGACTGANISVAGNTTKGKHGCGGSGKGGSGGDSLLSRSSVDSQS